MVSSVYLRLLIFLPAILIPVCASSSPAFLMMYSTYKLNKQGDNIQPWHTPFPIWNQSVVPSPVLAVASWFACRSLRRQVGWSSIPISWRIFQFVVIHTVKGFGIVNKAVDVFLEFSCFFDDPADVGNLISGSSAFSKSSLNIWKLTVRVLLKPVLENFEHYFPSVWDEYNCVKYSLTQAMQQEKQLQWEACATELETSPCLSQLEKACTQQQRPSTAKNKKYKMEVVGFFS